MKYLVVKTRKMLFLVYKFEFEKIKLKVLFLNTQLPFNIRQKAYLMLSYLNLQYRLSRVQYRCLLTNQAKWVIKFFKIYRFQLKLQFYNNYFIGLQKKSF